MVTKQSNFRIHSWKRLILAKNHMVTKLKDTINASLAGLILAKNHMVTKPQIHVTIYSKIIKY